MPAAAAEFKGGIKSEIRDETVTRVSLCAFLS